MQGRDAGEGAGEEEGEQTISCKQQLALGRNKDCTVR